MLTWLEDQRMAKHLGELTPEHEKAIEATSAAACPGLAPFHKRERPSRWAVKFVKAAVLQIHGSPSRLPARPTWPQLAREAKAKIVDVPGHPLTPGRHVRQHLFD